MKFWLLSFSPQLDLKHRLVSSARRCMRISPMSCRSFLSRSARKRSHRSPNNSIRLKDKDLNNVATPPISLSLKASRHTDFAGRGGRCCSGGCGRGGRCCSAGRSCVARRCCGAGRCCARGRGGRFLLLPVKRKSLFKIPHAK